MRQAACGVLSSLACRIGSKPRAAPSVKVGRQSADVAGPGLGEETVCNHLRKSQTKPGARSRPHAVAESLRQSLVL
jgi:hypothetical protein